MPWLCYLRHDWFLIDGSRRRTCLRCGLYQWLHHWHNSTIGESCDEWVNE